MGFVGEVEGAQLARRPPGKLQVDLCAQALRPRALKAELGPESGLAEELSPALRNEGGSDSVDESRQEEDDTEVDGAREVIERGAETRF